MKQLVTKAKGYHIGKGQKITVQEIVPLIDEGNGIWKLLLVLSQLQRGKSWIVIFTIQHQLVTLDPVKL